MFWWFRVHLITAICKVHIEHGWRHTVVYVSYIMFSWMTYLLPRKKFFLKLNFNLFYFQHKTYLDLSQNVLRLDLKNCKDFSQNNVQMKKKLVTVTLLAHFSSSMPIAWSVYQTVDHVGICIQSPWSRKVTHLNYILQFTGW